MQMRTKDKMAFRDAAVHLNCWILVREINPASLEYISKPAYTPKPIDCKPKTADSSYNGKKLAGLVVVPSIHGVGAFSSKKFPRAVECWNDFLGQQNVNVSKGSGLTPIERGIKEAEDLNRRSLKYRLEYSVDMDNRSVHFGCLKFNNKWIHGDYDLKDIILEGQERRNLAVVEMLRGQPHMRGPGFYRVQSFINTRIGKNMIQHSGEAQYADHTEDTVDVFGPKGQYNHLIGVWQIRLWYDRHNRDVIDSRKGKFSTVPDPIMSPEEYRSTFRLIPGGKRG